MRGERKRKNAEFLRFLSPRFSFLLFRALFSALSPT